MKRNLSTLTVGLLAFTLGALAVYSFLPENEVQAATVAPAAISDGYVLALDNETGLPVGAVTFTFDGLTCVALPNGAMECACPCDDETCDAKEVVPTFVPDMPSDGPPSVDKPPVIGDPPSVDKPPAIGNPPSVDNPPDTPDEGDNPNRGCNQGRGNGSEGCDPGNSNHNQESNDENERNRGGNNTPNRGNGNDNERGKGKGNGK